MVSKIFISYSRENKSVANNIATDITSMGYDVWIDKSLSGGETWWNSILENILKRDVFLFILSNKSLSSIPCPREYEYAEKLKKSNAVTHR